MKPTRFDIKVLKMPHKGCPSCKKANPAAINKCVFCGHFFTRANRNKSPKK